MTHCLLPLCLERNNERWGCDGHGGSSRRGWRRWLRRFNRTSASFEVPVESMPSLYFFTIITTIIAVLAVEVNDGLVPNDDTRVRKFWLKITSLMWLKYSTDFISIFNFFFFPDRMGEGRVQLVCYKILLFKMKGIK